MLGQVLYQDATALGLMATGLGCFLDDLALQPFELALTPLYHFSLAPGPASRYLAYNCMFVCDVSSVLIVTDERSFGDIAVADLHAVP